MTTPLRSLISLSLCTLIGTMPAWAESGSFGDSTATAQPSTSQTPMIVESPASAKAMNKPTQEDGGTGTPETAAGTEQRQTINGHAGKTLLAQGSPSGAPTAPHKEHFYSSHPFLTMVVVGLITATAIAVPVGVSIAARQAQLRQRRNLLHQQLALMNYLNQLGRAGAAAPPMLQPPAQDSNDLATIIYLHNLYNSPHPQKAP
jgi:hypothetical protein